jgi:hypothetical protein
MTVSATAPADTVVVVAVRGLVRGGLSRYRPGGYRPGVPALMP